MLPTEFDLMTALRVRGEEAREEGVKFVTKNLLKVNRPIDEIIEVTGLTREDVEKLQKNTEAR